MSDKCGCPEPPVFGGPDAIAEHGNEYGWAEISQVSCKNMLTYHSHETESPTGHDLNK